MTRNNNEMKKRRTVVVLLAALLLVAGAGIAAANFNEIIAACKAFLYCNPA